VLSRAFRSAGAAVVAGVVVVPGVVDAGADGLALTSPLILAFAAESAVAALSVAVARSPRACPQPIITATLKVSPAAVMVTRRRLVARFISFQNPYR
jgi:hypothetical protein